MELTIGTYSKRRRISAQMWNVKCTCILSTQDGCPSIPAFEIFEFNNSFGFVLRVLRDVTYAPSKQWLLSY